jgi:hypothetical protein
VEKGPLPTLRKEGHTMSMTIIEFLNARIAEDEAAESRKYRIYVEKINEDFGECSVEYIGTDTVMISGQDVVRQCMYAVEFHAQYTQPDPDQRMLAECAAKRALVENYARYEMYYGPNLFRILAAVYSDHPDYQDEWRP